MFIPPNADGNDPSASISRALGVFRGGLQQQADRMYENFDWVIESREEIVTKMNHAERHVAKIGCCEFCSVLFK